MDRAAVLEILEPLTRLKPRRVADSSRSQVLVDGDTVGIRPDRGSRALEVAPKQVPHIMGALGLPANTVKRLQTVTLQRAATELLQGQGEYSLLTEEGQVVDIGSGYRPIPAERVLKEAERAVKGIDFHRVMALEKHVVRVECLGTQERPVVKDDLIRAGALLHFSPLGTIEPVVQSFGLRLICTNGQVAQEVVRTYHYERGGGGGEGDDIWHWFRESIKEAYGSIGQVIRTYRQMAHHRIPRNQRGSMLAGALHSAGIRGDIANAIRARALEEPPETEYDVMNLITWATSHAMDNPRAIARAQDAMAEWSSEAEHRRRCPTCGTDR